MSQLYVPRRKASYYIPAVSSSARGYVEERTRQEQANPLIGVIDGFHADLGMRVWLVHVISCMCRILLPAFPADGELFAYSFLTLQTL